MTEYHIPVLVDTAINFLINPQFDDHIIVDCTLGGGGYTEKILQSGLDSVKMICIDKDINAIEYSKKRLDKYSSKIKFFNDNFASLKRILNEEKIEKVTGIVMDLGLSAFQLTNEEGFSFKNDSKLDMRADKNSDLDAEEILNKYSVNDLIRIFEDYGEIGNSKRLAEAVVTNRRKKKIETTYDLVNIVKREYDFKQEVPVKFLSKIFQALRIEVNDELNDLKIVLNDVLDVLEDKGRIVVVSYHSLEDRIVKEFFKLHSVKISDNQKGLKILTKKVVKPEYEEIKKNYKSRSAKLRCAEMSIN